MKKILLIIGIVIFLFIGAVGGYAFHLYNSAVKTVDEGMHVPSDREHSGKRDHKVNISTKEPLSFLLLGVDEEDFSGRSDTIMVVTVNPNEETMKRVSIPRDTLTKIIGRDMDDKINHANAFGGFEMARDTVEEFLNIPIDYFASVNMTGFKEIVDAVGGVTVENEIAFEKEGHTFTKGEMDMDGDEALAYVRMRDQDPEGDLGRNARQRKVLDSLIDEAASFSSVTRAQSILDALGNNIRTDLTFDELWEINENYRSARHDSSTIEIDGSNERIDGIWYYLVDDEEQQRVSKELRRHLELEEPQTVDSSE